MKSPLTAEVTLDVLGARKLKPAPASTRLKVLLALSKWYSSIAIGVEGDVGTYSLTQAVWC